MSDRRQVWATLAALLQRLENGLSQPPPSSAPPDLDGVQKELRKLGKAQFKANTLAESQAARWQETLEALRETEAEREQLQEALSEEQRTAAQRELLEAILPALDGLEHAMESGEKYLAKRDKAATSPKLTDEQRTSLVSPADRAMLAGWLDGLRLVRERLLAVLEKGGVTPIPTMGRSFDPYLHRAVGTTADADAEPDTIVAEERRGYRSPDGVLRYADVIVYKPDSDQ
jgi:molecular chaperone GrpE